MDLPWRSIGDLPNVSEDMGGHKVRYLYLIMVQGRVFPDVLAHIAEEKIFTSHGFDIDVAEVEAFLPLSAIPRPSWMENHGR